MLKYIYILFFVGLSLNTNAQDTINRRYSFPNNQYCIFRQVLTTDSCYYVKGIVTNSIGQNTFKNYFIKLNFNGSIDDYKVVYFNDTLGVNNYLANFIKTSDGGFAQLTHNQKATSSLHSFIKYNQYGDTMLMRFYPEIIPQVSGNIIDSRALEAVSLIQNTDSSYFASLAIGKTTNNVYSGNVIAKIDKNGELLWYYTYFQSGFYNISGGHELIKYNDTTLIMLISEIHQDNWDSPNFRSRSKLLFFDTLGNITQTKTFTEDTVYFKAIGLNKTIDGGLLYGGAVGKIKIIDNFVEYKAIITKLTPNFEKEWELSLYDFYGPTYNYAHFESIKAINDSEFVALGIYVNRIYYDDLSKDISKFGWLVKFNIHGEVLWERKYIKVPHYEGEYDWAGHYLYDIDITKDSGFIMVGQSINYYQTNPHAYGQLGWIVKTDRYGCLVPNCQQYDNPTTDSIPPIDSTEVVAPPNVLYPNPATTELYYYNTSINGEIIAPKTCYIYNMQGQIVQQFTADVNNTTYIIDVSQLASGTYIFKVVSNAGEVVLTSRFVKV